LGGVKFADLFVILKQGATPGPYATLADAAAAGAVTINYGVFLDNVVAFLVVAFAVFLIVRMIERMRHKEPPPPPTANEKECPMCISKIALKARRCPFCTSELAAP